MFFFSCSSIIFISFSNALLRGEYVNLACSIILLWPDGNISSLARYSNLSILPHDNADIFAVFPLIWCCCCSSLILIFVSSVVMINFYIVSKRFFLTREELPDTRVVSIIKKEYFFSSLFINTHKVNIWWMICCSSFVFNFHTKIVCWI